MANSIEFAPVYYDSGAAGEFAYKDYQQKVAMTKDITDSITRSAESINSRIVDAQITTANAIYNNTQEMIGVFNSGFSNVTREIGAMGANMSMGFAAMNTAVQKSAQAICDRLDTMNDIFNNPSLTKTRELYRNAAVNYNKGFFEEARDDLLNALASSKTDYISWFLLGKTYLFGAGEFSNVIDLDAAVDAMKNAVKFITPDARANEDAKVMASEMCFFLGLAQQTKALDSLHAKNEVDYRNYLEQAGSSYGKSFDYSPQMLEACYNRARCKALLGDVPGALADLETAVLADRNYCIKVYAEKDFSGITEQFAALIKKLKSAAFIPAKNDYDSLQTLLSKLASQGGKTKETVPATFNEELPYFDILYYADEYKRIIPLVKKATARAKIDKYKMCICSSQDHNVGLKKDGTVVAVGENDVFRQCDVSGWRDIVAITAKYNCTFGLKADGTVVTAGKTRRIIEKDWLDIYDLSGWRDIVAISAGHDHVVGLKADGTVVADGRKDYGPFNVSSWRDIVAVAAGGQNHTIGLKADGTVIAVVQEGSHPINVSNWRDIVAVAASNSLIVVGLKADGTVIVDQSNYTYKKLDVSGWRDIVAISASSGVIVGLKADGTVVTTEKDYNDVVSSWRNIVAISIDCCILGLKADGTVVTNRGYDARCNVGDWRNIGPVSEEQDLKWKQAKAEQEARIAAERQQAAEAAKKAKAEQEAKEKEERRREEQQKQWQAQGLCKYCGGELGGLFKNKCKSCGKKN